MPAEGEPIESVKDTIDQPPIVDFRDVLKLSAIVIGTAIGMTIAHYVEKRLEDGAVGES